MKSQIKKSAGHIAQYIGGKLYGDAEKIISGVAPFEHSSSQEITLAGEGQFLKNLDKTNAGAVIVPESFKDSEKIADAGKSVIAVKNPRAAWAKAMQLFYPPVHPQWKISDAAHIGKNFVCGENVHIGPFAAIGDNVQIGKGVVIYPHAYIGDDVVLGDDVIIHANVTICFGTQIGNRVIIHPSTVIGGDGFGFAPDGDKWEKIPQVGNVRIDDDVEIGGSCTINRATFGTTRIGAGVKIDSQVHIAHNVTVGENSIMVAQVGIAGSATIGKHVILAGRAGVAQHLKIGDGAILGPTAGVAKDVPENAVLSGAPAIEHRHWLRVQNVIPSLPELKKKISRLESLIAEMKDKEKNAKV
ncbi:MAG: UDP-3-O-(3-hydroxymyristoyl)glucosamine N-acyltransferase [Desulfobacterales bacterium]